MNPIERHFKNLQKEYPFMATDLFGHFKLIKMARQRAKEEEKHKGE